MYTSIHIKANELDESFIAGIKAMFKNKRIAISVEEDLDETEYLHSSEANRKHLADALKNAEQGKTTKVDIDQYLKK